MTLLESMRKMTVRVGRRGRKGLMAMAVVALFVLNLSSALAAGGDSAWIGDRVWKDEDGLGNQNEDIFSGEPEPGLNGVGVYLYDFEPSTCGEDGFLEMTTTEPGASQDPDDWPDGIYNFDMGSRGTDDYWVCVDESTLPTGQWTLTTGSNPQQVAYTGDDDFSVDFGYDVLASPAGPGPGGDAEPTAVTLASFMASPASEGVSPWPWLPILATLTASGALWIRRR